MKNVKTTPVDENLMDMVGHCCGARFTALPTLDDGIDFTPTAAVKAEMDRLQAVAQDSAAIHLPTPEKQTKKTAR